MKRYYVYYSYEEWGRGYIGQRECGCLPEQDVRYFGSFTDKTFKPTKKIILQVFNTREDAIEAEILLHNFYQVDVNPHFVNRSKQTTKKFSFYFTEQEREKARERALKLRIKPPPLRGPKNAQYKLRKWVHKKHGTRVCSISDLVREFKNDNLTDTLLSRVALGRRKSHRGWRSLSLD